MSHNIETRNEVLANSQIQEWHPGMMNSSVYHEKVSSQSPESHPAKHPSCNHSLQLKKLEDTFQKILSLIGCNSETFELLQTKVKSLNQVLSNHQKIYDEAFEKLVSLIKILFRELHKLESEVGNIRGQLKKLLEIQRSLCLVSTEMSKAL
jgi:phosphomevalonate kinase